MVRSLADRTFQLSHALEAVDRGEAGARLLAVRLRRGLRLCRAVIARVVVRHLGHRLEGALRHRRWLLSLSTTVPLSKIYNFAIFFAKFANFWRARSRLYQNEFLEENMRLTAFFKLYKICILLHW